MIAPLMPCATCGELARLRVGGVPSCIPCAPAVGAVVRPLGTTSGTKGSSRNSPPKLTPEEIRRALLGDARTGYGDRRVTIGDPLDCSIGGI